MIDTTHKLVPAPADSLHDELRALIASSRQRLAGDVNAELTRLYWNVGQRLRTEVLGEGRASYGAQLLDQLGQQLTQEFGRGFESRNLRRRVKFAEAFPDAAIVSTLSTQLSWSHMVAKKRFWLSHNHWLRKIVVKIPGSHNDNSHQNKNRNHRPTQRQRPDIQPRSQQVGI